MLESEATPLPTGPLSPTDISWVGACLGIGGLLGSIVLGWPCEKFGRKPVHLLTGVLNLVSIHFDVVDWHKSLIELNVVKNVRITSPLSTHRHFALMNSLQIGWILVIYAENIIYLCVARFLIGLSGAACFIILPLLVNEISVAENRGVLGAIFTMAINSGILVGFLLGYLFEYSLVPKMLLLIPLVFLMSFALLPESPWFLMKQKKCQVS